MKVFVQSTGEILTLPAKIRGALVINPKPVKGIYEFDESTLKNADYGTIEVENDIARYVLSAKGQVAKANTWITDTELGNINFSGIDNLDLIFRAKINKEKVKKNEDFYEFAVSLRTQMTPAKRIGTNIYSFLLYLETSDGFDIDESGNIINPYSDDVEIIQLTTNLEIVDGKIKEITE